MAVSQDEYIKKVDNPDAVAYNYRDGEKVLKENEQSHFRKFVENINRLAMNNKLDLCFDAMETACNLGKARVKDIERAKRILRKPKKRGIEPQFRNPEDSKEACHGDSQLNNKRTAFDTAVLRRSKTYISPKETS